MENLAKFNLPKKAKLVEVTRGKKKSKLKKRIPNFLVKNSQILAWNKDTGPISNTDTLRVLKSNTDNYRGGRV